jgi:hypothetical protein
MKGKKMANTPFIFRPEDENKKIYVVKQEYILTVEQYVKADNEDEAFNTFLTHGGIKYEDIDKHLTNEKFDECETEVIDIDSPDTKVKYVGTVCRISKDDPYDLECQDIETEYKDNVVAFNKTFGRHA